MRDTTRHEIPPIYDLIMKIKVTVYGLAMILSGAAVVWIGAAMLLMPNGSGSVTTSSPSSTGGLVVTVLFGLGLATVGINFLVWEFTGKRQKVRQREANEPVFVAPMAKWVGQVGRITLALFVTLVWAGQLDVFQPGTGLASVAVRLIAVFAVAWLVVSYGPRRLS